MLIPLLTVETPETTSSQCSRAAAPGWARPGPGVVHVRQAGLLFRMKAGGHYHSFLVIVAAK